MADPTRSTTSRSCSTPVLDRGRAARGAWWTRRWATAGTPRRSARAGAEVLGIDRDPDAIAVSRARAWARRACATSRRPYALAGGARGRAAFRPDFILLDLGVSSRQLDEEARGFTFRPGAPLDMRMGAGGRRRAADLLNEAAEAELAQIFARLRRRAASPAPGRRDRAAPRAQRRSPSSDDLVNAIRAVLGPRVGPGDFARLFQAVRIAVNDELAGLARALPAFRDALVPGGRLAVISYHSGEDRLVKHAFREWARGLHLPAGASRSAPAGAGPLGRLAPRKPIVPAPRSWPPTRARGARSSGSSRSAMHA